LDVLHEFLSQIGEIRYIRSAYTDENAETRGAYVEFSEQPSIPKVLSINGFQFFGRPLLYVEFHYRNPRDSPAPSRVIPRSMQVQAM
jgi:hypothetical protein